MSSIKKNFLYNAFYNVLVLILPLATTPYLSRVMGAEKIGIYSYAYSTASYFALFILLGLNNYGNRTIASVKNNKNDLSKNFCSIYAMQLIMSLIMISIYILYVLFIAEEKIMASIQIFYLFSAMLDINWFFFGMELFKLTVTRNTIIKIINLICIFTFVKTKNDIYIYGLIMVIGMLISQISLWLFVPKYVKIKKITFSNIIPHVKPNLILFIPVIAISLYTIMDKIMLGIMSSMTEVGYYESANKLTAIPSMAITSLGTVMLPRMSNLIANGKNSEANTYIYKSLILSVFLSSAMAFGISSVANEFVPLFYGNGFEKCKTLIPILIMSSIFISWANVIRTQYLIPHKKDRIYIISALLGATTNIILNFILIPHLLSIGAAIATLIAEFTVCTYQTISVKNKLEVFRYIKYSLPFFIYGIIMFFILVNFININNNFIAIFVKIVIGLIIYFVSSGIYYTFYLSKIIRTK